ncbi:PREDICTED: coiled-coil domain-containing protein 34-like [Vollenhovia emeryi]|uniref:coiled-coil domain-containing protein 34-like n=1 Tax=Vollenhovia emeryi TaxID=411798 RepID=UPI0005F57D69|nr:PREDICTED: coiled-coil domain-containing protein 34-like [Vollenhovia emeryi]
MINDSIDSWRMGSEINGFARKGFGLVDHRAYFDEDATLTRVKNSNTGPEIRYINPAIYTESIGEEGPENDREQDPGCREGNANNRDSNISVNDLPVVAGDTTCADHANEHPGQSTYRCYTTSIPDSSLEPSTARSATSSASTARVERRCKIVSVDQNEANVDQNEANVDRNETIRRDKCVLDGRQVVRISTTSITTKSSNVDDRQASNGCDLDRRIAYSEWMRRKHEAAQRAREKEERAARKREEEEERAAREKEERTRLEKENFLKWVERKRQQELDRRAMLENELELQRRLKKLEDNLAGADITYLRRWYHRKKEERKTRCKEQEARQRKLDEERERRLEQSRRAYEKWRENSKNKPKPATQGLLPHQKAKPGYVNPIPWQSIVEIDPDEAQ